MLIARAGDGSMRDAQSAFDQVIAFAGDDDHGRRRGDGARPGPPRPAVRHGRRRRARGRAGGLRARRPRGRVRLRPAARRARAGAADPRPAGRRRSIRRGSPIPRSPPKASASAQGPRGAVLARRPDARVRRADEGGVRHPRLDAAALSPRDGAAALDPPAQAGAAERSDSTAWRKARRHPGAAPARAAASPRPAALGRRPTPVRRERRRPRAPSRPQRAAEAAAREAAGRSATAQAGRNAGRSCPTCSRCPPIGSRTRSWTRCEGEEVLLRHGRRAGAADRRRGRPRRLHVRAAAPRAASRSSSRSGRWLETIAAQLVGPQDDRRGRRRRRRRRPTGQAPPPPPARQARPTRQQAALREQALADSGVQAMLDVFAAEIKDVEEM